MKKVKIYTLGGYDMRWRKSFEEVCSSDDVTFAFIHPPLYRLGMLKEEFENWNMYQLCNSDIVIMNMGQATENDLYELGIVKAINTLSSKRIVVIGVGKHDDIPSFRISKSVFHYEPNYEAAVDYIKTFLLI